MRILSLYLTCLFLMLSLTGNLDAQQSPVTPAASSIPPSSAPDLFQFSGTLLEHQAQPLNGPVRVTFRLHPEFQNSLGLSWREASSIADYAGRPRFFSLKFPERPAAFRAAASGSTARLGLVRSLRRVESYGPPGKFSLTGSDPLISDNWLGGTGNWSVAGNWSGGVPNNGVPVNTTYDVFIDKGNAKASAVTLDINAGINNLAIDSDDSLSIRNGSVLRINGSSINNAGKLSLNSTGNFTELVVAGANVTLSGGGTVTLSNNVGNYIFGATTADTLTNQETIQGAGTIGNGQMTLVNSGTINANQSAGLTINPAGGITNTGTIEATGGTLLLSGTKVTNTGGKISDSSNKLQLTNTTINGGAVTLTGASTLQLYNGIIHGGSTLTNSSTGTIEAFAGSNTLGGTITNPAGGVVKIDNGAALNLENGSYPNLGSVTLNSTGNFTELVVAGVNVTLSGGNVTMSNKAQNYIFGATTADTLTNQETIQGAGTIGNGQMGLINSGTILANQSIPLIIQPSSAGFTNSGTLQVNSADLMHVLGGPFTNFSGTTLTGGTYNVSGTLKIDQLGSAGGEIVTDSAHIALTGLSSSFVDAAGKDALSKLASTTATGSFALAGGRNFTTAGNFANSGTLTIGSGSKFDVNGNLTNFSGSTLTGGIYNLSGTLQFNGANIVTNAANITLSGTSSRITNQGGTVNALANFATNSSNGSFTLSGNQSLTTAGKFTNAGALTIATGSTFVLGSAGTFTQTGGTTTVDGTLKSSVNTAALNLNGGSLFGTGTLGFGVVDSSIITPGNSKTSSGMLAVSGTYQQKSTGALNIAIGGTTVGTKYDQLNVSGAATVNGILNLSLINGFVPTVGTTFEILNAKSVSGTFSTVNGTHINASEHFVVACDTTDCDVTVTSGAAISSAGTAGVQRAIVSTGRAQFNNVVLTMPRNRDVAGLAGVFYRDQLPAFRMPALSPFTNQIAARRSTPSASLNSVFLSRTERPSGFALRASSPELLKTSRSFNSSTPPHPLLASSLNHGGAGRRGLEMGLDLLSLVGNPRHFTRSVFSQTGPANATGLTFNIH
jgi:hypothetical protein